MSLLSDPDYMIHQLRLTYLRSVEDPYASRLLSFNPRHLENPHVLAAGLADPDRWPQLTMPSTPKPEPLNISDSPILSRAVQAAQAASNSNNNVITNSNATKDEVPKWNGPGGAVGGASLKYTTTILGPTRTGMVGMRTTGRRTSNSSIHGPDNRGRADSNPNPSATGNAGNTGNPAVYIQEATPAQTTNPDIRQPQGVHGTESGIGPNANQIPTRPPIAPRFSNNAEMEAKRKARIQARHALAELRAQNQANPSVATMKVPENDNEEAAIDGSSESDTSDSDSDGLGEAPDDELDPEFDGQNLANSAGSDDGSLPSTASGISTSQSSGYPMQPRTARKLSQTGESGRLGTHTEEGSSDDRSRGTESERPHHTHARVRSETHNTVNNTSHSRHAGRPRPPSLDLGTPKANNTPKERPKELRPHSSHGLDPYFARRPIQQRNSKSSASTLTKMLAAQAAVTENPFTELYGAIAGRGDTPSMTLNILFPESKNPFKFTKVTVRKDATVEEVIGFSLWTYWEQKLEPGLDEGMEEDDPRRETVLSAAGWILRIGEEDGEVDEDFPAPDRTRKISNFSFPAFAICKATPSQVQQNKATEAKITRRLSRLMIAKRPTESSSGQPPQQPGAGATNAGGAGLSIIPSAGTIPPLGVSVSVGGTGHQGPPVFLRICVPEDTDAVLRYTTINVTADWYMADVLEHICRRRKIKDHKDYALVSQDKKIVIPGDRTVASLQGETELMLGKRSTLGDEFKGPGRATDPNASIFAKRMSEVSGPNNKPASDFTDAYQSWVVYRKLPVMVGRLERTLAIDGDHIHIMPSTKGFLDNVKTTSYHVDAIQSVRQAKKAPSNVKITVSQDGTSKTYDLEAENEATAATIVQRIKSLVKATHPNRHSILRRSRRF